MNAKQLTPEQRGEAKTILVTKQAIYETTFEKGMWTGLISGFLLCATAVFTAQSLPVWGVVLVNLLIGAPLGLLVRKYRDATVAVAICVELEELVGDKPEKKEDE